MRVSNKKIIESYNLAVDRGHPDPLGLIARAEIKTGLDSEKSYKGSIGAFGVNKKQALDAGYSDDEIYSTEGNFEASIDVDLRNLRKNGGDVDLMFRDGNGKSQSQKSTDRFMVRLDKKKKELSSKYVFNGSKLVDIQDKKKELDISKAKKPEDVSDIATSYGFSPENKAQIDEAIETLVRSLVGEALR